METFEVSIVELQEIAVAGLTVLTSVQKAPEDCPRLWQNFRPYIFEMLGTEEKDRAAGYGFEAYGVCKTVSLTESGCVFEYTASIPVSEGTVVPPALTTLTLAKGLYAKCLVPHLREIKDAYDFLCNTWFGGQDKYMGKFDEPCLEFYPSTWVKDDVFYICAPVVLK